jgi:hypothetical protein
VVRLYSVQCLRAPGADTKPRHHLVEDEQCAIARAQRSQCLKETRAGRDQVHVARNGLDDDRCDVSAARFKRTL